MQPVLQTARLHLRPAAPQDLDALWALWTNPLVRQFLWDDVTIGREQARDTIEDFRKLSSRGLGLWLLEPRADSEGLIGCGALAPVGSVAQYYLEIAGAIEPVIALVPGFWHRGYASEALRCLVEYATETLKLDRLVGVTDVPNVASDRMLRRAGFEPCAETDGPRYRLRHYRLTQLPSPRQ